MDNLRIEHAFVTGVTEHSRVTGVTEHAFVTPGTLPMVDASTTVR